MATPVVAPDEIAHLEQRDSSILVDDLNMGSIGEMILCGIGKGVDDTGTAFLIYMSHAFITSFSTICVGVAR
jgi:hypothetical protein